VESASRREERRVIEVLHPQATVDPFVRWGQQIQQ